MKIVFVDVLDNAQQHMLSTTLKKVTRHFIVRNDSKVAVDVVFCFCFF